MGRHNRASRAGSTLTAAMIAMAGSFVGLSPGATAWAASPGICVTCQDPSAQYLCTVPTEASSKRLPRFARKAMRVACLRYIANTEGHGVCSVRRNVAGPCLGERVVMVLDGARPGEPPRWPAQPRRSGTPPQDEHPTDGSPQADETPPTTVVEAVDRASEETTRQLRDAGETVSTFMRKSWACVSSLFADC